MGLWHARLLAQVARALERRGVRCVFALSDPVLARRALGPDDAVVPAPVFVPPGAVVPAGTHTRSFADILGSSGWGDAAVAGALMASWDTLLSLVRPDLVVADHAPTLLAYARQRLPRVSVGLGFTTPPASLARLPALHDGPAGSFDEDAVLAAVNAALAQRGRPTLARLSQAYDAEATFITVMAELDPYQGARVQPALGPLIAPTPLRPDPETPGVFAYLAADDPRTAPLIAALAEVGPVRAFVRRADAAGRAALRAAGAEVFDSPTDVAAALAAADVVAHHGGAGVTQDAILGGRPQLLLPRHLEQQWNAHVVERHGVGAALAEVGAAEVREALGRLRQPPARKTARAWAVVAGAQVAPDAAEQIAARCEGLLAG